MPRSSEISVPPVRMAMSCSIALRRSPKPGALTAQTGRMPRSLLTTRALSELRRRRLRRRSAEADRSEKLSQACWHQLSRRFEIFFSCSRIRQSIHHGTSCCRNRSRSKARCSPCRTACPQREFSVVSLVLPSSTVMTPSRPTLSIASAMSCPFRCRCWQRSHRPA